MKFTQLAPVRWKTSRPGELREGFTLFALGEDGQVYKSISERHETQHRGWLPMREKVLPADESERPRKPKKLLAVGEKVRIFDYSKNKGACCVDPPTGIITAVIDDSGYDIYEVAWPAEDPEEQRQVVRLYSRQVERYRELTPLSEVKLFPGKSLVKGDDGCTVTEAELKEVSAPTVANQMCPAGCGHKLVRHNDSGCLAKVRKGIGLPIDSELYDFCKCMYRREGLAELSEEEESAPSFETVAANPAQLLPDLPGKSESVAFCEEPVTEVAAEAPVAPAVPEDDYPF